MYADRAPRDREPSEPPPILRLSLDLILCICDHLGVSDIGRLSGTNKSLRESIQHHLYMRIASSSRGIWRAIEFVQYAIEDDWNINSFRLMFNAFRQFWPCLDDMNHYNYPEEWPLFAAITKNRADIVSMLEETPKILKARHRVRLNSISRYTGPPPPMSLSQYADSDSALEFAVMAKNLELTERFLANPEVSVRPLALCEALLGRWKPGIAAILACKEINQAQVTDILNRGLFDCHSHHQPDWIEYLVSIGADPQWSFPYRVRKSVPHDDTDVSKRVLCGYFDSTANCGLHHRLPCVPFCRTVLSRSLATGNHRNVKRLLEIVSFSDDYMIHVLYQSIRGDCHLEITKIILERVNLKFATWAEAYITAVMVASNPRCQNEKTIRYLLDYFSEKQRLTTNFDLNQPLEDSRKTILECVLVHQMRTRPIQQWEQIHGTSGTICDDQGIIWGNGQYIYEFMNKQSWQDWTTPLFHFNADASLLSTRGWKLFREYLHAFVNTKKKRDQVLTCCRRMMSYNRYRGVRALLSRSDRES
ncbi:hypothetical protein F4680DRAFT_404069 [Xylaria scruposa]|nr:hypothetical protein F4680DRAFT_404069 [Xylaria scruposa]